MTTPSDNSETTLATKKKFGWKFWFRVVVFTSVALALAYTIWKSLDQIREQNVRFDTIDWRYCLCALLSYSATLLLSATYWFTVLRDFQQRPKYSQALFAFFASQLGKYIPGKAMVVVIRTDLVRGDQVAVVPAAVSVFVETLSWIFVGSAIACGMLTLFVSDQPGMIGVAIGLMVAGGVLTWPPVFGRIARLLVSRKAKEPDAAGDFLENFGLRTTLRGWLLLGLGWAFNGLSLWFVVRACPGADIQLTHYWLMLACVSLATVAGFVSLIPGGMGVRELVIIPLLGSTLGVGIAIVSAVLIRLVWMGAELSGAAIIYGWKRWRR